MPSEQTSFWTCRGCRRLFENMDDLAQEVLGVALCIECVCKGYRLRPDANGQAEYCTGGFQVMGSDEAMRKAMRANRMLPEDLSALVEAVVQDWANRGVAYDRKAVLERFGSESSSARAWTWRLIRWWETKKLRSKQ